MSWSLRIHNGDLSLGTSGLNTVTGSEKLTQDLRCALLEPMGTDPLHPSYGSILDGGVDPQGNAHASIIGQTNDHETQTLVAAEVRRICRSYQGSQIARNQTDVAIYGKSTLTADEALLSVADVSVQQFMTQMMVTVHLQTGLGSLPVTTPFSS